MRTWTALVSAAVFAVLAHRSANAQERDPAPKKDRPPAPRRFFDRPIDYWQQGLILENRPFDAAQAVPPPPPDPPSKQGPSEWSRRAQRPDGTFATEELPRPLVQVLEDPSPENVRAYFEWRLNRTRKILRAAEAMKAFRASGLLPAETELLEVEARLPEALPGSPRVPELSPPRIPGDLGRKPPFTVLYFHRKGCGHCDQEDLILRRWLADKPEGTLSTLEFGEHPELWREFRVRGTPSLVLQSGSTRRSIFLEGLHPAADLDHALADSARTIVPTPENCQKGGPP